MATRAATRRRWHGYAAPTRLRRGDSEACRESAWESVVIGTLMFLLGAVGLWLLWRGRGDEVVRADPPPGSPNGDDPSSWARPPSDARPVELYIWPQNAISLQF